MIQPRLVLCSGASISDYEHQQDDRKAIKLTAHGKTPNVHIQLENLARAFLKNMPPRLLDLLEIAAYVYTTDCAVDRGNAWTDDHTVESWGRDFRFVIPVRDSAFWKKPEVQKQLADFLQFLSDDKYAFEFCPLKKNDPVQSYLDFGDLDDWPFHGAERVLMFSGGLDSLAGAVETAMAGDNLVLVSHRAVTVMDRRVRDLVAELRRKCPVQIIHVPVWVNKQRGLDREHTQRTRSFLFSALGVIVAESIRARGVRFFENGIVSLNLPVADEVLRARASRTTHPLALKLFTEFYKMVTEHEFVVDNPFIFKTKTDVVSAIADHGQSELIRLTSSCAQQGFFKSKTQWHCGTCSQCIDRRVAILAAGQEAYDPGYDYATDVFSGSRKDGYEKNMAVNYARLGFELYQMTEIEMATKFNLELARAARCFPKPQEAAQHLIEMHKRQGEIVYSVMRHQIEQYAGKIFEGSFNSSSLLALVADQQHLASSWRRYAECITDLLKAGIPVSCKTHKPKNEPHLQEMCDGILKGHDTELVREFPFMRWSSTLTKADWSIETLDLLVEMKYVRTKKDIHPITEDIAADITKYGDNNRHVLYIVYDPAHAITDDIAFADPILKRPEMLVQFIR
jgi:hypothetical protein